MRDKMAKLKQSIILTSGQHHKELLKQQVDGPASQKSRKLREQLEQLCKAVTSMHAESSGTVALEETINLQGSNVESHKEQSNLHTKNHADNTILYKTQHL